MVGLISKGRLSRLEGALNVRPGLDKVDPLEKALRVVQDGTAWPRDFRLVMEPELPTVRAWLAARSARFQPDPETGKQPWVWWPADAAAAIAAIPLGEEPEAGLVESLLIHIRRWHGRPEVPGHNVTLQRATAFCYAQWRSASAMLVALGAPDGRPLRTAIGRGEFSTDAELRGLASGKPTPAPASRRGSDLEAGKGDVGTLAVAAGGASPPPHARGGMRFDLLSPAFSTAGHPASKSSLL